MRKIFLTALLITGAAAAAASGVQAQEKKIQRKDLPAAVEKTVARESEGATVKGFSTEIEKGKRLYEAELVVDGHGKDISIDASGNVLEIEEEVAIDALPAEVKAALLKAAGSGTIDKVEWLTKKGALVAYEADVTTGKKHSEIQVGPGGKKLARPQ